MAMGFDPRQVLAAFLTLSMFCMLGNMVKRDHFDTVEVSNVQFDVIKVEQTQTKTVSKIVKGPWAENVQELKTCWSRPTAKYTEQSEGFVTFSLTGGPEHHVSQIADAVVIARYLGATLVLPDIRGSELGQKRNFGDMYDVEKFTQSLDGVVKVVNELPTEVTAAEMPPAVKVPHRVSAEFIVNKIEPIYRAKQYVRVATFFPAVNMRMKETQMNDFDSTACLAMFGSLELKQSVRQVAEQMIARIKTLSNTPSGHFVAIDLRVDVLQNHCKGRRSCYSAQEVADFLNKIGFEQDTTIYVTQTWWQESLNVLKETFPKTYTKDDILPSDKKGDFLGRTSSELARGLDFYICSRSEVFVPAISGLFYSQVTGKRIASGKIQILVPAQVTESSSIQVSDYVSPYVSKKNHLAYSCYC